ncbi:phosphopantetheine-binding protein [Micromonospora rifamycinica]|uniref:phosphopantetheine-binding protein n=1 Tax=Micromonospora rifamycinica TaxID=291594 RepID=UPI002E2993A0|nr:phosphopantetheine-binding protein [Micromonospora rifamycinica]
MTAEQRAETLDPGKTSRSYLTDRLKTTVEVDQDLFDRGLVDSMFAMELVVHLEQTFQISAPGTDPRLDNVRSVPSMAALVRRLRDDHGH